MYGRDPEDLASVGWGVVIPPGFDPESMYQACLIDDLASYGSTSLGGLLAPLRVLTFWHMKRLIDSLS